MLEVKNINVFYDAIHAIKDVSFGVEEGETVPLIGANGAGKPTILHTISCLLRSKPGVFVSDGLSIEKTEAHDIVKRGLAQVPEGRPVFAKMTVRENLEMGAFIRTDKGDVNEDLDQVLAHFPRLKERIKQPAGTLSGGEQQMLAMGRALMSKPQLLMLDEPSMGLAPILVNEIFEIITRINQEGTTVLLVEQNAKKALAIADRAYVLETGQVVLQDKAQNLLDNAQVKVAYLGG